MAEQAIHSHSYNHSRLYKYSQGELDELFEKLPTANLESLEGNYFGRLFAVIGLGFLPRWVRICLYNLLPWLNPWRGKFFNDNKGANVWLRLPSQLHFGFYTVVPEQNGQEAFLNYDIDRNPSSLRPVRGEARQLDDSLVLARMNYETRNKSWRVLYFTLEKRERETH